MHPTVDEQLQGIDRLLRAVATDPGLSSDSTEALADASRMLRRLEASWPHVLPFLTRDNHATAAVLAEVAPLLPAELAEAATSVDCDPVDVDEVTARERNEALRALLARAIVALPDGDAGAGARSTIGVHLRQRIDLDPTLGRVVGGR